MSAWPDLDGESSAVPSTGSSRPRRRKRSVTSTSAAGLTLVPPSDGTCTSEEPGTSGSSPDSAPSVVRADPAGSPRSTTRTDDASAVAGRWRAPTLGRDWEWDGSSRTAWRSTFATVVDDYGNLVRIHLCGRCKRWFPCTNEFFNARYRNPDGRVGSWASRCRGCAREVQVARRATLTEKQKQRELKAAREAYARRRENEEWLKGQRAKRRVAQRRWREANPDAARAANHRWYRRVREDPARWEEYKAWKRIEYRMMRGMPIDRVKLPAPRWPVGYLPSRPLMFALHEIARRDGVTFNLVCERINESERNVRRWRVEGRIGIEGADRVLCAADLLWWEVWPRPADPPERGPAADVLAYVQTAEAYLEAHEAFEGAFVPAGT